MRRLVIAAPSSGSGKTTVTLGIMDALRRRGLRVAPFKVGPDFIDPGYHRLVTGAPSVNLDGWMCGLEFVSSTFGHHTLGADIAVVEGVMGLFDGIDGVSEAGSSAEIAKLLGAPVLLVVDARSQARSAAALVHGFAGFDPAVQVAGVVFNNVGSANHERILREALAASLPQVKVIGCLPRDEKLAIPSRHLGLTTAEDNPLSAEFLGHLGEIIDRHLDLDALLDMADAPAEGGATAIEPRHSCSSAAKTLGPTSPPLQKGGQGGFDLAEGGTSYDLAAASEANPPPPPFFKGGQLTSSLNLMAGECGVRIAVARDSAFCFVYEDNLRLLREQGAEVCGFSPLADPALPEGISGIYLPGGYPELFAAQLAGNLPLKAEITGAIEAGMPVYAECGGFIYLTCGLSEKTPFLGVFPVSTRMLPRRKALGYREIELLEECVIGRRGERARGHEFHYSEMAQMPETVERSYQVSRKGESMGLEGYRHKNCLASYVHLHFGGAPGVAESFVAHCRNYSKRSGN